MDPPTDQSPSNLVNKSKEPKVTNTHEFKAVDRSATSVAVNTSNTEKGRIEHKYTPSYTQIDAEPRGPTWKVPEHEFQFFYAYNDQFKHNIELNLARESSEKRVAALSKLYWEYKNKDTFQKAK